MKTSPDHGAPHGFSLVELLMVMAVISMLAAVAIFNMSSIVDQGRDARTVRNAKQFCDTYAAARVAGAKFQNASASGILDELAVGKKGHGVFATSVFRLPLGAEEKRDVLRICDYDPESGGIRLRSR